MAATETPIAEGFSGPGPGLEEEESPDLLSPWGEYKAVDTRRWASFMPQRGMVIKCVLPFEFVSSEAFELTDIAQVEAAFVILDKHYLVDGSLKLDVKSLGCTSAVMNTQLSNIFNRRPGSIHICAGFSVCEAPPECKFHLVELFLCAGVGFASPYVGTAGKKILKQVLDSIAGAEVNGDDPHGEEPEGDRKSVV